MPIFNGSGGSRKHFGKRSANILRISEARRALSGLSRTIKIFLRGGFPFSSDCFTNGGRGVDVTALDFIATAGTRPPAVACFLRVFGSESFGRDSLIPIILLLHAKHKNDHSAPRGAFESSLRLLRKKIRHTSFSGDEPLPVQSPQTLSPDQREATGGC